MEYVQQLNTAVIVLRKEDNKHADLGRLSINSMNCRQIHTKS